MLRNQQGELTILIILALAIIGGFFFGAKSDEILFPEQTIASVYNKARLAGNVLGLEYPADNDANLEFAESIITKSQADLDQAVLQEAYEYIFNRYENRRRVMIYARGFARAFDVEVVGGIVKAPPDFDFKYLPWIAAGVRDGILEAQGKFVSDPDFTKAAP